MRNQQFTGTFGGNVGTNVLNPSQGRDPFLESTPAPKPQHATRTGRTFGGTVAARLPRAANVEPGFGQMNLPVGGGREAFKRLGRRAGDEAVENYNAEATTWNEQQAAAKESEVAAYNQQVAGLNNTYQNQVNAYNKTISDANARQQLIDATNSAANSYNNQASIYRASNSRALYSGLLDSLNTFTSARNRLNSNGVDEAFYDGFENFRENPGGGYTIMPVSGYNQPNSTYDTRYFVTHQPSAVEGTRIGNKTIKSPADPNQYTAYNLGDGISGTIYQQQRGTYDTFGRYQPQSSLGQPIYNPFTEDVRNIYEGGPQNPGNYDYYYHAVDNPWFTANVPYVYGGYNPTATSENSWFTAPDAPDRPDLPDAPDPTFDQRQMKDALPDLPGDRRLAGDQREIIGGELPPQEAGLSGDSFGVANVNRGNIEYRELDQINQSEQRNLGNPQAYRLPGGTNAFGHQWGNQVIPLNAITNASDTHYYVRPTGIWPGGWVEINKITPLY